MQTFHGINLRYLSFILLLPLGSFAQQSEDWIKKSPDIWPIIALTNHVTYMNGDHYIHPSFSYAGTGFLIDTGKDTLAATAKHALWVAKNKASAAVEINAELREWIMKPKGNPTDSVEIDSLINEDKNEVLEGPNSSITERDWLVFAVKKVAGNIQALKPRYTPLVPGEKVYILSCPYSDSSCLSFSGTFIRQEGLDLSIDKHIESNLPGSSGSPVIDAAGNLVGILSSTTYDSKLEKNIIIAISTEYLQNVLEEKKDLNKPKQSYAPLLLQTVLDKGAKQAVEQYQALIKDPQNFYRYNLRSASKNGLIEVGERLMEMERAEDGIEILKCNIQVNKHFYRGYNILAKAYLMNKDKEMAIKYYKISTEKYDNKENNEAFKALDYILNN